jgi:hypothetical protein
MKNNLNVHDDDDDDDGINDDVFRKFKKKGVIGLRLRRVTSVSRTTRIFLFVALFSLAE